MSLEPEIDEGKSGTGQRKKKRTAHLPSAKKSNRPLGMEAPGRNDDGIKGAMCVLKTWISATRQTV